MKLYAYLFKSKYQQGNNHSYDIRYYEKEGYNPNLNQEDFIWLRAKDLDMNVEMPEETCKECGKAK